MGLPFLISLLIGVSINDDPNLVQVSLKFLGGVITGGSETDTFNGSEATEFALQVLLVDIVTQASYYQGLEGITTNIGVFVRIICVRNSG